MYEPLGRSQLKSGEWMEIGVVNAPDVEWASILTSFLHHKGDDWLPQIIGALNGPLDELSTRFYVGRIDGELACHIMVAGDRGVGILAHVYTMTEHRRKGAILALLSETMLDAGKIYRRLTLGTEFEGAAYRIYYNLGFRSVGPECGEMLWAADNEDDLFAPGLAAVRPVRWQDWGFFNLLALRPIDEGESLPRSPMLGLDGQGSVEWAFLRLQSRRERDPRIQALALVNERGATVGWALREPDSTGKCNGSRFDLYTHPSYVVHRPLLISAMDLSEEALTNCAVS